MFCGIFALWVLCCKSPPTSSHRILIATLWGVLPGVRKDLNQVCPALRTQASLFHCPKSWKPLKYYICSLPTWLVETPHWRSSGRAGHKEFPYTTSMGGPGSPETCVSSPGFVTKYGTSDKSLQVSFCLLAKWEQYACLPQLVERPVVSKLHPWKQHQNYLGTWAPPRGSDSGAPGQDSRLPLMKSSLGNSKVQPELLLVSYVGIQ